MIGVDPSPDPDHGTVRKIPSKEAGTHRPVMYAAVLSGKELADAIASHEMLFTRHKTTCLANKPRNPKPAGLQIHRPTKRRHP